MNEIWKAQISTFAFNSFDNILQCNQKQSQRKSYYQIIPSYPSSRIGTGLQTGYSSCWFLFDLRAAKKEKERELTIEYIAEKVSWMSLVVIVFNMTVREISLIALNHDREKHCSFHITSASTSRDWRASEIFVGRMLQWWVEEKSCKDFLVWRAFSSRGSSACLSLQVTLSWSEIRPRLDAQVYAAGRREGQMVARWQQRGKMMTVHLVR
jgi:hypothetical protein